MFAFVGWQCVRWHNWHCCWRCRCSRCYWTVCHLLFMAAH